MKTFEVVLDDLDLAFFTRILYLGVFGKAVYSTAWGREPDGRYLVKVELVPKEETYHAGEASKADKIKLMKLYELREKQ